MSNTDQTVLLGQLIAEIAKFGGSSKEDADRLARILLPHIKSYAIAEQARIKAEARLVELDLLEQAINAGVVPASTEIQTYKLDRLENLMALLDGMS